jgi:hypothetical protein
MKRTILITTVAGAVLAVPALAQFGFGLTVFDPTSWGELVSQLRQMQQQYSLLSQTYSQIRTNTARCKRMRRFCRSTCSLDIARC